MHAFGWVAIALVLMWVGALVAAARRPARSGVGRGIPGASTVLGKMHDLEAQVRRLGAVERFVLVLFLASMAVWMAVIPTSGFRS